MKRFSLILVAMATFFLFSVVSFADTVIYDDDFSPWQDWQQVETYSPSTYSVYLSFDFDSPSMSFSSGDMLVGNPVVKSFTGTSCDGLSVFSKDSSISMQSGHVYKLSYTFTFSSFPLNLSDLECTFPYSSANTLARKVVLSDNSFTVDVIFESLKDDSFRYTTSFDSSSDKSLSSINFNVTSASLTLLSDSSEPDPEPDPEPEPDPNKHFFPGYDDDLSPWDSYVSGDTVSFFGSGEDSFNYSGYLGSDLVFYFTSSSNSINGQLDEVSYIDSVHFFVNSDSAFLSPGKLYRISGSFRSSFFDGTSIDDFHIGANTLAVQVYYTGSSDSFSVIYFDAIVECTESTSASAWVTFLGARKSALLYGASVNAMVTELSQPQKSIQEWLEDIYNALVGESGDGEGTSNPELDDAVTEAGELQGSLDDFESSIQGDFESSFNELDLGGFQLPTGILSSMSWIGTTWTSFFNEAGELQYIILFPCFVGLALLLIGRAGMAMHIVSMKDKRNNKGDGT